MTQVTHGYVDESPSWSPDGAFIAFHRELPHKLPGPMRAVHVVRADGSDPVLVGAFYSLFPSWAPVP